jgi:hypothetical protein
LIATSVSPVPAAHSLPPPLASTETPREATEMDADTRPSAGSSRHTVPSLTDTHSQPSAASTSPTLTGNGKVCTTRLVAGSMRLTVPSPLLATHTDPPATNTAPGALPTLIAA